MWNNFWKGGRTIQYKQTANFTYTVPAIKVPALDWTNFRLVWIFLSMDRRIYAGDHLGMIAKYTEKKCYRRPEFFQALCEWRLLRELEQQSVSSPPGFRKNEQHQKKPPPGGTR